MFLKILPKHKINTVGTVQQKDKANDKKDNSLNVDDDNSVKSKAKLADWSKGENCSTDLILAFYQRRDIKKGFITKCQI